MITWNSMNGCTYACMYAHTYVCMPACMYVRMYVSHAKIPLV